MYIDNLLVFHIMLSKFKDQFNGNLTWSEIRIEISNSTNNGHIGMTTSKIYHASIFLVSPARRNCIAASGICSSPKSEPKQDSVY